jgi:hypothetical protein
VVAVGDRPLSGRVSLAASNAPTGSGGLLRMPFFVVIRWFSPRRERGHAAERTRQPGALQDAILPLFFLNMGSQWCSVWTMNPLQLGRPDEDVGAPRGRISGDAATCREHGARAFTPTGVVDMSEAQPFGAFVGNQRNLLGRCCR